MTSSGSISFDDAAGFYDKTRALDPRTAARITALLEAELRGRGTILEVGVGTGRIALPLNRLGIPLVGLDLAGNMLNKLIENSGGSTPFPLIQGDATRLPFREGIFGGGIASWILHLVPGWREVLSELVRVCIPGAVLVVDAGGDQDDVLYRVTLRFRDLARVTDWPRGAHSRDEVDEVMVALGARPRSLEPVVDVTEMPIEDHIGLLENGIYSVAWGVPQDVRSRVAAELRTWARAEFGSITEARPIETTYRWRAYDC